MSNALFKGSTAHPLSQEEINAFMDSIEINTGFWDFIKGSPEKKHIRNTLRESIQNNSTCREQVREILKNKQTLIIQTVSEENTNALGWATPGKPEINLNTANPQYKYSGDDINIIAGTIFHEALHLRQNNIRQFEKNIEEFPKNSNLVSRVVADAETQGFSARLHAELMNRNEFKSLYKKWIRISNNPSQTPKGYLKFEPKKGLTGTDLQTAREQYARQMAGRELQNRTTEKFMMDPNTLKKQDYSLTSTQRAASDKGSYFLNDIELTSSTSNNDLLIPKDVKDAILSRNPGLNPNAFNQIEGRLSTLNQNKHTLDNLVKTKTIQNNLAILSEKIGNGTSHKENPLSKQEFNMMRNAISKSNNKEAKRLFNKYIKFQQGTGKPLSTKELGYLAFSVIANQPNNHFLSPEEKMSMLNDQIAYQMTNSPYYNRMINDMRSIDFTPVNPSASRALSQNSQRITNQTENQNRQYTPQSKDYS